VVGQVYNGDQEALLLVVVAATIGAAAGAAADNRCARGEVDSINAECARLHHARGAQERLVRAAQQPARGA
jgi:hypothetical protein